MVFVDVVIGEFWIIYRISREG